MAFPQFTHPDVTTTVVFTTGIASPATIEWLLNQSFELSDAVMPFVYTYGPVIEVWTLGFANLPEETHTDLLTFLTDPVINRRESAFVYTDHLAVARWMQLYDERLHVQQLAIGTYNLALRLVRRRDLET